MKKDETRDHREIRLHPKSKDNIFSLMTVRLLIKGR